MIGEMKWASRGTREARAKRLAGVLGSAADGNPVEEAFHAGAFAPEEREKFAGVEIGGFLAEEGFEAPLDVGRGPGAEAITLGDDPVVAESVQHVEAGMSVRIGASVMRQR
jgi:hypothetical protein